MKQTLHILLVAVLMLATTPSLFAQEQDGTQRLSRKELAEVQAHHIASSMTMDKATTEKFVTAYCNFQQELWALGPRPGQKRRHPQTDAEAAKEMEARFDHSQKILDLRKKYYKIYSQFLSPQQIRRVYTLERQMMNRLARHRRDRARRQTPTPLP